MTTFTNPHTAEVAHDTRLLDLLHDKAMADMRASVARDRLMSAASVGHRRGDRVGNYGVYAFLPVGTIYEKGEYDGRHRVTAYYVKGEAGESDRADRRATVGDALTVDPLAGDEAGGSWDTARRVEWLAKARGDYPETVAAAAAARDAVVEHEKDYTGWSRYFLVVSSDGHVHSTMECSTCYESTRFAPLPSLSGASLDEAVALVGSALCSTCYPLAPTDWVDGVKVTGKIAAVLLDEGEDAFRAKLAELAAKRAERCDADPFDHGGYDARMYRPYAKCNKCGEMVSVTSTGKMRAHKPKK